jgi:hypothetical protein
MKLYDEDGVEHDSQEFEGINVNCFVCSDKIKEKSGILFSPPTESFSDDIDQVDKFHLCKKCFNNILNFMMGKVKGVEIPNKLHSILYQLQNNKVGYAIKSIYELIELLKTGVKTDG